MPDEAIAPLSGAPPEAATGPHHFRATRLRRLRLAFATSFAAKGASLALQFTAVPVALHVLGPASFGLFLVIYSLVSWIGLTSIGIGPGLTLGIARAVASADAHEESAYFWTSVTLMIVISTLLAATLAFVVLIVPINSLIGVHDPLVTQDALQSLLIVTFLSCGQLLLSVVDAARLGYQELHISNLWTLASTGISFVALLELGRVSPTVTFLVVALSAPPIIVRALNGGQLMRSHANLRTRRLVLEVPLVRKILMVGIGFAAVSLASFLSQQLGLVLLAQREGPEAVVAPGTMLRLILLASSPVAMLTQPLWPALTDATARSDSGWARFAFRRVLGLALAYSGVVCGTLLVLGQELVQIWTGGVLRIDETTMILFALYFPLGVWSHVHAMTMVGLGEVRVTAAVLLVEGLAAVVTVLVCIPWLGGAAVPLALVVSTGAVSGWMLPLLAARSLSLTVRTGKPEPSAL